ncbi:MAG: transglutaminase-like domain-containing protein [Candidatus Woesearchaeota archaeon]
MKKFMLIIALILISSSVIGADNLDDIINAESALMRIQISSEFEIIPKSSGYSISQLEAKTSFYPQTSDRQTLHSINIVPGDYTLKDNVLEFLWEFPKERKYYYMVDAEIVTSGEPVKVKKKIPFPRKDNLYPDFASASEHIDSDDEDIIELARSLSLGKDDYYEVVLDIAKWVNHNIDYNLSTLTADVSQPASWVLENRKGVCDEMTSLFIALLRAVNIPAKYVSGVSYTNSPLFDYDFGAHGWAEVYFPDYGWIPFDVTYGEYGYIDASHVALKKSIDSGESSTFYGWRGRNVDVTSSKLNIETEALSIRQPLPETFDISVMPLKKNVGFGSYNIVEATIKNNKNYYIPVAIRLSKVQNMEILTDNPHFLLFRPDEIKKIYWIVKVSEDLSSRYTYTFPLSAERTRRNESGTSEFKVTSDYPYYSRNELEELKEQKKDEFQKSYSEKILFYCESEKDIFYEDEIPELMCTLDNLGKDYLNDIEICIDSECQTKSLPGNSSEEITFLLKNIDFGTKQHTIIASNQEISKSDSVEISYLKYPKVNILNFTYPKSIEYDKDFNIRFIISGHNEPKNIVVNLNVNSLSKTWNLDSLPIDREFIIKMNSKDLYPSENKINLKVVYYDYEEEPYVVEEDYSMNLENLDFFRKIVLQIKRIIDRWAIA